MAANELERERAYVRTLYARLDELQREAFDQLAVVRRQNVGGNHQNRSERDAFARIYEDRILQLRGIDERLAFGRLDLEATPGDGDDDSGGTVTRYIGRIGLRDDDHQPILLDWRVPQASAFYRATAANPLGARARRHLISQGRDIVRIDDEIFDAELLRERGSEVQGEGALLAALSSERTGRMADIVATIQAEQDRIIRSELAGVLVVQGGPGTGKTAVALHRAAYLLYSHRERLRGSGVLIVGPSPSFLRYIESVLPSLGETGVVLASVGQLYPGVSVEIEDASEVAAIKGQLRMAELVARAVSSRQRVPAEPVPLTVNGDTIVMYPKIVADAMVRARESRKPYNEARVVFVKSALTALTRQWAEQLRAEGQSLDESDLAMLREDLRSAYDVRVALNTAWLPLTPEKLVRDLFARPQLLKEAAPDCTADELRLLARPREAPLTVSDIPLLDEAAELLGNYDVVDAASRRESKQQRKRDIENAERAIENMGVAGLVDARDLADGFAAGEERGTLAERAADDRTWVYGHIVVDEAQELSPMQWRMLRRRCPARSFTVVGDIAQAASASAASDWPTALSALVGERTDGDRLRLEELTVNYRTPSRISGPAERMARAHGLRVTTTSAVREGGWPIRVTADLVEAVERDRAVSTAGTLAVIAPPGELDALAKRLEVRFGSDVGWGEDALVSPIAVLTPTGAKGLEFDAVVVVDPVAVLQGSPRGPGALYVAMTRPTQRLTLVADGPLPAGILD